MKQGGLLAVLPARSGSKGVKHKNTRSVGGKPLISWSIEAALAVEDIAHLVVSTDDPEVAKIAQSFGVEVLERPRSIARDDTPMIEVIQNVLNRLDQPAGIFEHLLLLQPTAPARTPQDITDAYNAIKLTAADSLVSVFVDPDKHPARCYYA